MTKEQFIKRMNLIQNFQSEQQTLSVLIDKITEGYNDILAWWLYEDVDKVIYDKDKEISVRTLEELYDYIIKNK